jgi:CRP/FNR family cyclic AMP-dependent transcriptional regulator
MDDTVELLGSVPLFGSLSMQELGQIRNSGREIEFRAGTDIVREAGQDADFYLILNGEATVWVQGRHRQTLSPGDHFGEMSVLDGGPRSATVRAEEQVRVLRLSRWSFLALLDEHGAIGRKLLVELSSRLRAAEGALVHW